MRTALLGIGVSGVVYAAGLLSWVWLVRRRWQQMGDQLPAELEALREQATRWRLRSQLHLPSPRAMAWTVVAALVFAGLWVAEFGLVVEVLYVIALSAWWTAASMDAVRADARARRERHGSHAAGGPPGRTARAEAALNASAFLIACGFLGTACFFGRVLAEAL